MAVCLAATRVYSGYKPFALSANDTIAETAQWQLFFAVFAALAIRANFEGESLQDRAYFDALVVMLLFVGVIMGLFKYIYWKVKLDEVRSTFFRLKGGEEDDEGDREMAAIHPRGGGEEPWLFQIDKLQQLRQHNTVEL